MRRAARWVKLIDQYFAGLTVLSSNTAHNYETLREYGYYMRLKQSSCQHVLYACHQSRQAATYPFGWTDNWVKALQQRAGLFTMTSVLRSQSPDHRPSGQNPVLPESALCTHFASERCRDLTL